MRLGHLPNPLPVALFAIAALALPTFTGTAGGDSRQEEPPGDWYVSEYNGILPIWIRESDAGIVPQDSPEMVIYEVTRYPDLEPTPGQAASAEDLRKRSLEAAKRNGWLDFDRALADGFELMFGDQAHYVKREFIVDGRVLDPDRPEFLLYFDTPRGKRLAAYMFLVSAPEERGPQVGGPLTVWHYHMWSRPLCLWERLLVVGMAGADGACAEGEPARRSPEMVHVWFVERPAGWFSTDMSLEPTDLKRLAERGF